MSLLCVEIRNVGEMTLMAWHNNLSSKASQESNFIKKQNKKCQDGRKERKGGPKYMNVFDMGRCIQAKSIHRTATTEEIENISFMYAPPTRVIKVDVPVRVRSYSHSP